jgi:hypothetical protein
VLTYEMEENMRSQVDVGKGTIRYRNASHIDSGAESMLSMTSAYWGLVR